MVESANEGARNDLDHRSVRTALRSRSGRREDVCRGTVAEVGRDSGNIDRPSSTTVLQLLMITQLIKI